MQKQQEILKKLEGIRTVFSEVAVQCVEMMFGKDAEIDEAWELVSRLDGQHEHLITMGSANSDFSALIIAGISADAIQRVLGEDELDKEYLFDVLGEFVNSYCALLDDNEEFDAIFGKQIQAVPLLYSGGAPFMPFLRGIQGKVKVGDDYIFMGYVIRENSVSTINLGGDDE